jgi:hypothetical protein
LDTIPIARNGEKTCGTRVLAAGASFGPTLRRLEAKGAAAVSGIGDDSCEQTLISDENLGTKIQARVELRDYRRSKKFVRSAGTTQYVLEEDLCKSILIIVFLVHSFHLV